MNAFKLNFETALRLTGLLLIGKGLLCWLSQIGIMYGYAERGMIDNYSKIFLVAALAVVALVSCVETARPTDSGLSGTGGPKDWETGMPGMGSVVPENR